MRVALVCPYDLGVPGGVQTHVSHLARELQARGDTVLVVAPGEGDAGQHDDGGTVLVGPSVGIRFNGSVAPITLRPTAARTALDRVRGFAPDVVHVHEPAVPLVSFAVTLRCERPTVGTFHAWSDTLLTYRAARPLIRPLVSRLKARIAVSAAAADYHARALGLRIGSFRTIPNGVDVQRFATAEPLSDLRDDRPTILFVGRLERRKGLEQLIRAFVELKSTRPEVRLVVVGDGPERERCQTLLPTRLQADATFLGEVDQETLPRVYASSDVVAVPAIGGESFGIVLLEAMAAGRAVVASDIPGFRSVMRDGVEGRLVPPGDVRTLTHALAALLSNASLRVAMGRQGSESVARYDWPEVAARVREVYADVVSGASSALSPPPPHDADDAGDPAGGQ